MHALVLGSISGGSKLTQCPWALVLKGSEIFLKKQRRITISLGFSIFKVLIFFTSLNGVSRSPSELLLSTNHNVPTDVNHSASEAQDQKEHFIGKNWEPHRYKQGALEGGL